MTGERWEERFDRVVRALQWAAVGLGGFLSFVPDGARPATLGAAAAALGAVALHQAIPLQARRRRWAGEVLATAEVAAAIVAVGLTGGVTSPYLLFSLTPVLFASAFFGWRLGLTTALLAAAGLLGLHGLLSSGSLVEGALIGWTASYLLIAVTFGYARRLLLEAGARTEALLEATDRDRERLDRLDAANRLLSRLAELTDASEMNPVAVGSAALDHLANRVPFRGAVVALEGEDGPVVVARRTYQAEAAMKLTIPLQVGSRRVGTVTLAREEEFTDTEHRLLAQALQPVALAFSNILLFQDIARRAVREERTRLARELHDEIGPSLASLGLSLDLALIEYPADPELTSHLQELRTSVSTLVEDVRGTVADLRETRRVSLLQHARSLAARMSEDDPKIVVDLDEHRLARPAVGAQVAAIVTEAVRNAVRHSGAGEVRIEGYVDAHGGHLSVIDDGDGFDPSAVPAGHFGLTGMRERAASLDARLEIDSTPGTGTRVGIMWGPQ